METEQLCLCELRRQHNLVHSIIQRNGATNRIFTQGWSALTGLSHDELVEDWLSAVHPEDRDKCDLFWQRALNSRTPQQFDMRVRKKDGTFRCLLADVVPIETEGDVSGVVGTFIDISQRKSRQLQVQHDYNLISLVADSLHALIAYVGVDKRYIYVNRGYSEFFDKPRDQFAGKHISEVLGNNFARVEAQFDQAIRGEKQRFEAVMNLGNEPHRISAALVPHYEDGGGVKGVFVLAELLDEDVVHSHFEDLERFMSHWQDNPKGFCQFVGKASARLAYRNFSDLFFYIGTSYFAFHCLPDRIDHMFAHHDQRAGGMKGDVIKKMVSVTTDGDSICIVDKHGRHKGLELMIWCGDYDGYHTYFIRPNGDEFDQDDGGYWNFRRSEEITEGVIVYPEARGFYDFDQTRHVADLIVLASNLTGFVGCEC